MDEVNRNTREREKKKEGEKKRRRKEEEKNNGRSFRGKRARDNNIGEKNNKRKKQID